MHAHILKLLNEVWKKANHFDICGIIPFFKDGFHIMFLDIKTPANNSLKYSTR